MNTGYPYKILSLFKHSIAVTSIFLLASYVHADSLCEKKSPPKQEPAFAQCSTLIAPNNSVFSVAVRHAPPFIYEVENRSTGVKKLKGIAIDYWEEVARQLGLEYRYVCMDLYDTVALLGNGQVDIAISPLTITKQREKSFDFSHQYFNSGLVFASSPAESNFDFEKAFNTLANTFAANNVLYLFVVFFSLLLVLFFLSLKNIEDYQAMPVMRKKTKPAIIFHVMLYSLLNISGMRKDIFGFSSIGMQLFSLLILIFGISVSASLFSMVTAALTQSVSPQKDFSFNNIDQYNVTTLQGSTAQHFLCDAEKQPATLEVTDTWQDSLEDVANGTKDLVLGDWVQLVYLSQQADLRDKVTVHDRSLRFEPYGWGLKTDHPFRDAINQELIGLLRDPLGAEIVERYIGDKKIGLR